MTDGATEDTATQHYESLYHCLHCRMVFLLEETDKTVRNKCPNCGPTKMHKVSEADNAF